MPVERTVGRGKLDTDSAIAIGAEVNTHGRPVLPADRVLLYILRRVGSRIGAGEIPVGMPLRAVDVIAGDEVE